MQAWGSLKGSEDIQKFVDLLTQVEPKKLPSGEWTANSVQVFLEALGSTIFFVLQWIFIVILVFWVNKGLMLQFSPHPHTIFPPIH